MSIKKELIIPDIREAIYSSSNRLEATKKHIAELSNYNSLEAKLLRNKLETDYLRYISNPTLQSQTKKLVERIHKNSVKLFPSFSTITKAREKSLVSHYHKDLIALKDGKGLDLIMDTRACRVIIDCKEFLEKPEKLIKALGKLLNETLTFLIDKGFQPIPASPAKDTKGFVAAKHPDIYIPKTNYVLPEYQLYVKDYISHPKGNGYQSFHVIVIDPNGNPLEIQFRTYDMDYHAENKLADHDLYKQKQIENYNLPILDRKKVNWSNYRYETFPMLDENGKLIEKTILADDAGLEKSLSIRCLVHNP